ncbi:MAG TPA: hypothetical protein VMN39_11200 [Longimicrobiaceae bacterium]|nr:hypothetical protein [Longimicrobiaceae bacterium]
MPRFRHPLPVLVLGSLLHAGVVMETVAQAQVDPAGWATPRTEHGHPDLQGNWTNETLTPLERPRGLGPTLTPEEAARLTRERPDQLQAGVAGAVGTYNDIYFQHGDGVAVVGGEARSSLITFPADGRIPPLTAPGQARLDSARAFRDRFGPFDNPENLSVSDRCLVSFGSNAGPPMLPNNFYNNNYTIVQTADHVLILTEMVHDARIIRLGERRPLPLGVRPWFGDSWGRWEADTLVVETTNFHPLQRLRGVPSDALKVTERLHRVDEGTILYRFTVEDPSTYGEVWGGEIPMRRLEGLVYEYGCHEGNYAMFNILSGARAEERRAVEEARR